MKTWISVLVIVVLLGGGWWYIKGVNKAATAPSQNAGLNGSADQGNMGQPDNGQVQMPMADGAEGVVIGDNVALGVDATGGAHLIAYNGMTLYTYTKDTGKDSTCYDACATNWPPYIAGAEDNVHHVTGAVTGTVDSIVRKDGSAQVTYNGHPLYFYAGDKNNGDMTGQAKAGVWYVVKP